MSILHQRYIGLDVHRASIDVAIAEADHAPSHYTKLVRPATWCSGS
ncbi:MAG: hypothetical protein JOZ87_36370 [Chloroflexi bacterium]|nr:hypothetical protein [Chloroflexota bacterium]